MRKRILALVVVFAALGYAAWAGSMTWTGVVSDSQCKLHHSSPSQEAAECVEKCVAGGGQYVFVSDGKVYEIEPQEKFKGLGGKGIKVTGELRGKKILVASVEPSGE